MLCDQLSKFSTKHFRMACFYSIGQFLAIWALWSLEEGLIKDSWRYWFSYLKLIAFASLCRFITTNMRLCMIWFILAIISWSDMSISNSNKTVYNLSKDNLFSGENILYPYINIEEKNNQLFLRNTDYRDILYQN